MVADSDLASVSAIHRVLRTVACCVMESVLNPKTVTCNSVPSTAIGQLGSVGRVVRIRATVGYDNGNARAIIRVLRAAASFATALRTRRSNAHSMRVQSMASGANGAVGRSAAPLVAEASLPAVDNATVQRQKVAVLSVRAMTRSIRVATRNVL